MGQSRLQADVMGTTGMYTFCWCDLHGPQSNGQPAFTGLVSPRGGVDGATNDSASRYHSTEEATRQSWCPCCGQNLANHTSPPRNWIFASTERLHTRQRLFVIE